jgi:hypothetical protein
MSVRGTHRSDGGGISPPVGPASQRIRLPGGTSLSDLGARLLGLLDLSIGSVY